MLSPSSRTLQNHLGPPVPSAQNTENQNVTAAGGQDLVLFLRLHIWGQGEGKEKEPYGEEELGEPLN